MIKSEQTIINGYGNAGANLSNNISIPSGGMAAMNNGTAGDDSINIGMILKFLFIFFK